MFRTIDHEMFFLLNFIAVLGFYMRFEDDSVESAKNVKQWNVKIISVSIFFFLGAIWFSCPMQSVV